MRNDIYVGCGCCGKIMHLDEGAEAHMPIYYYEGDPKPNPSTTHMLICRKCALAVEPKTAVCKGCEETLSIICFARKHSCDTGKYRTYCRKCWNDRSRVRNAKHRRD